MEEYRNVKRDLVCAFCSLLKYFLFPEISKEYLLYWPNLKYEGWTSQPINLGMTLYKIAKTGDRISLQVCQWCHWYTFLHSNKHMKTCEWFQEGREILQKSQVRVKRSV